MSVNSKHLRDDLVVNSVNVTMIDDNGDIPVKISLNLKISLNFTNRTKFSEICGN